MTYTQVTVSGFNSSPPTDDGSTDAINRVTWAGIKTKLGDPLNTAIASIDDNVGSACDSIDAAVIVADAAISSLSSTLSVFQGSFTAPSGTSMVFMQTSAPTGWTKDTTHDDKMLRLVTGTPSTGGSTAFTSVFGSRTITSANMPAHTHTLSDSGNASLSNNTFVNSVSDSQVDNLQAGGTSSGASTDTDSESFSADVTFSGTTSTAGSGTAMDFDLQYADVITATKD